MPAAKVTQISAKFPTELANRLKAEAERRMVSPQFLIVGAVRLFLESSPLRVTLPTEEEGES